MPALKLDVAKRMCIHVHPMHMRVVLCLGEDAAVLFYQNHQIIHEWNWKSLLDQASGSQGFKESHQEFEGISVGLFWGPLGHLGLHVVAELPMDLTELRDFEEERVVVLPCQHWLWGGHVGFKRLHHLIGWEEGTMCQYVWDIQWNKQ